MIFLLNLQGSAKERCVREGGRSASEELKLSPNVRWVRQGRGRFFTEWLKLSPSERWVRVGGRFWRGCLMRGPKERWVSDEGK